MAHSRRSNGSGGPFTGEDVRCALERLGWQLIEEPAEDELAAFRHADVEETLFIDLDQDHIFYGDRYIKALARLMIHRKVAGSIRRRAIQDRMLRLRSALMDCRELGPMTVAEDIA